MNYPINSDYHNHRRFSPEGHDSMVTMCNQAVENGLRTIAFMEHVEWQENNKIIPNY
jgi:histidinol phosphatase-like PHP family hydrolase